MNNQSVYPIQTNNEKFVLDYRYFIAFVYVFVQTTICSIGFILNLINFTIFLQKNFTAPAYIVMTILSIADAITLGVRIPQGSIFLPYLRNYTTDSAIYTYVYSMYVETPVSNMTENISAWLTVILAIERYISMKHWSLSKRYFTRANTRRLVGFICLVAIIFNMPYFAIQKISIKSVNGVLQLNSDLTTFSRSTYYAIYSWIRIAVVQIIPLCFLCISNCLLFILVSQHNRRFVNQKQNINKSAQKHNSKLFNSHLQLFKKFKTNIAHYLLMNHNFYLNKKDSKSNKNYPVNLINDEYKDRTEIILLDNQNLEEIEHSNNDINNNNISFHNVSSQSSNIKYDLKSFNTTISIDKSNRRRNAQTKLTILLIIVILLFLIGQLPQSLAYVRVFTTLGICSIDNIQTCVFYHLYRVIAINLAQFAFTTTFFIYLLLNKDFRQTLKFLYCCFIPSFKCKTNKHEKFEPHDNMIQETNYFSEPCPINAKNNNNNNNSSSSHNINNDNSVNKI